MGERMVVDRDLIVQNVLVGLVEIESLLDDGLAVLVHRQAAGIEGARVLQVAGLDLESGEPAAAVRIDPLADRIAHPRGVLVGREVAPVGIDAA